jgi:hypothetical protein
MLHASGAIDQDVSGGIQRNLDTAGIQTDGVANGSVREYALLVRR